MISKFVDRMTFFEDLTSENIGTHEEFEYKSKDAVNKAITALEDGFQIGEGYIRWYEAEDSLADILSEVLEILEKDEGYRVISGDLSY